jgi:RHS repeat-associated protein
VSSLRERPIAILPGQYFDAETGLHQNWFRDYDPSTGRYLQSDPIGLNGGLSTYGYAGQNPLLNVDPLGLEHYVLLVGEPGLGSHNVGSNFSRAATTAAAQLEKDGHTVSVSTVATAGDVNRALALSPLIDGGLMYFGHGWEGVLYPGEQALPGTNIDASNVDDLKRVKFGKDASATLYSCNSGRGGSSSIAQSLANRLGIPVTGFTTPLGFTGTAGIYLHGQGARPPDSGPLYMTPAPPGKATTFLPK